MTTHKEIPFKRVSIGANFSCRLGRFRKIAGRVAVAINENGTGRTHEKIRFSNSAACKVEVA